MRKKSNVSYVSFRILRLGISVMLLDDHMARREMLVFALTLQKPSA